MEREKFVKLVKEALDALATRFRKRIYNVTVLVEDLPLDGHQFNSRDVSMELIGTPSVFQVPVKCPNF